MIGVGEIVSSLISPVTELIGKVIPDKDKAADLAYKISTLAATQSHAIALAQIGVNKAEAESGSVFKGGWRPAAGWTCVGALANNYIIVPYAVSFGLEVPVLDLGQLTPILLGMLGLSYNRSQDKKAGVASL
tara:strand:- start:2038 stop:2433 length:396 start_codon:yes stop_codon:yes gene_type:complete